MQKTALMLLVTFSTSIVLVRLLLGGGDQVTHHGFQVESEGLYTQCLICHDGIIAEPISPCLATVCFLKDPHPVNKTYPPIGRAREFATTGEAERAGIRFLVGKVDCVSCHDLKNPGEHHLRIDIQQSRLCRACHLR